VGLSSNQDAIPAASRKKKMELKINKHPPPTAGRPGEVYGAEAKRPKPPIC